MAAVSLHLPTEIILFSTESYPACHHGWASAAVTLVSAKDEWEEKVLELWVNSLSLPEEGN